MAQPTTVRPVLRPSRARYWVIVFAVTLAVLSYIDRVCISQAAPLISRDLGLTKTQMGDIFSAFAIAYALFEIPGGWMGDWMGARKVLMRIVIWWSAFTALTGYMWNFVSMWVTRFLFGAGEAGCFPNLTKAFSSWLPTQERSRAQGILWMSARWGGAFTPLLVVAVLRHMDWRTAFVLFGAMGVIWAAVFYWWYRDNPRSHPSVNEGELALLAGNDDLATGHGNVPWNRVLTSRSIWFLWAQYFFLSFPWYFYITWLPTYLRERYPALSDQDRAWLAVFPLFFGGVGCLVSGFISPRIARATGNIGLTRRAMSTLGFFGASAMLVVFVFAQQPDRGATFGAAMLAMSCLGFASFFNDLVMPNAWAACMDMGGKFAGTVSGSMNMMGNIAGFVAPPVAGRILDRGYSWDVFLYTMAAAYILGGFCWPFIDPVTPIEAKRSKQ